MKAFILNNSIPQKDTGCWLWKNSKSKNNYGVFYTSVRRNYPAHEASYVAFFGPVPPFIGIENVVFLHKCDVKSCVNPTHIIPGTNKSNSQEFVMKKSLGLDRSLPLDRQLFYSESNIEYLKNPATKKRARKFNHKNNKIVSDFLNSLK